MKWIITIVIVLVVLFLLLAWLLYRFAFLTGEKERGEVHIPSHGPYAPLYETMRTYVDELASVPYEGVTAQSEDGLTLYGRYYENRKGAPLLIFFHGYKGHAYMDGCPAYAIAKKLNINLLLVDQRGHGKSEGTCTTMAVKEREDCACWSRWAAETYPGVEIILMGVSMGGATVTMSLDQNLSDNVKCVVADCGFTSPKEILCHCIPSMIPHAPVKLCYCAGRLGAKLFGHFDPNAGNAKGVLAKTDIPVLFIHGDIDDFVPWQMSVENHEVCHSEKKLLLVKDAPHAASYFTDADLYVKESCDFITRYIHA